jgi:hypothetical protein
MRTDDNSAKGVRFGCGFFLGVVSVGLSMTLFSWVHGWYAIALILAMGCICGTLAAQQGDKFFEEFLKRGWW